MKYLFLLFLVGCDQPGYTEAVCQKTCAMVGSKMNHLSLVGGCICKEIVIEARP